MYTNLRTILAEVVHQYDLLNEVGWAPIENTAGHVTGGITSHDITVSSTHTYLTTVRSRADLDSPVKQIMMLTVGKLDWYCAGAF